jgi:hypothetical protein
VETRKWKRQNIELLGESGRPHWPWPYHTMALGELRSQSAISPYEEEEYRNGEFKKYHQITRRKINKFPTYK